LSAEHAKLVCEPLARRGLVVYAPLDLAGLGGPSGVPVPVNDPCALLELSGLADHYRANGNSAVLETIDREGDKRSAWMYYRADEGVPGPVRRFAAELAPFATSIPVGTRLLRGLSLRDGIWRDGDNSSTPVDLSQTTIGTRGSKFSRR
jgi:hypothetical protein